MTTTLRRLPGFAIAAVALALSASLAFAAQPVGGGLANASTHSGKTVPVLASDGVSSDEGTETEADTEPAEPEAEADSADHCNVDLTQDPAVLAELNHGSVVCTAAHMATPDGFDNHGAWVKSWAHLGKGGADASTKKHGNSSH